MVAIAQSEAESRPRMVYAGLTVPFLLLVLCFAAWGAAANLTDVLVGVFRTIFDMSNFQSALVQFAYYGAYFSLAVPAALINRRFGYKTGVLTGLGLAAVGGLLFIPASQALVYELFLLALFVLAAGLSILEASANPFVIAMGPERSATQRLNLAQSFNPTGANIGVLLGAVLILPQLSQVRALEDMTERGAKGILITPADSEAIVPAIEKAREAGVTVITLDMPAEPESAMDALFATDDRMARAEADGLEPRIAMLDLAPGLASGQLRHEGFLAGFGLAEDAPQVVGAVDTEGNRERRGRVWSSCCATSRTSTWSTPSTSPRPSVPPRRWTRPVRRWTRWSS